MSEKEPINFDKVIGDYEKTVLQGLWSLYETLENDDCEGDEVLDDIEKELERVRPDGECAIDHEEVWRATGEYYRPLSDDK